MFSLASFEPTVREQASVLLNTALILAIKMRPFVEWSNEAAPKVIRVLHEYRLSPQISERVEAIIRLGAGLGRTVLELPMVPTAVPSTNQHATMECRGRENRRALVNAYIDEVSRKTRQRITRKDIWIAAQYTNRTEFQRWQRDDPKHPNESAHKCFMRILTIDKPHLRSSPHPQANFPHINT
jgi:hypothetical protein